MLPYICTALLTFGYKTVELLNIAGGEALKAPGQHMILNDCAKLHDISHMAHGKSKDLVAKSGDVCEDSLTGQDEQRLPHRRLADIILIHQLLLIDHLTAFVLSADDPVNDLVIYFVL